MFSHFIIEATISRLILTGSKSSFQTLNGLIQGHMKPLADEQQNIGLTPMANMYSFTTTSIEDIREADRVNIIDGHYQGVYAVRGVNPHVGISVSFMRCILTKEELGR